MLFSPIFSAYLTFLLFFEKGQDVLKTGDACSRPFLLPVTLALSPFSQFFMGWEGQLGQTFLLAVSMPCGTFS